MLEDSRARERERNSARALRLALKGALLRSMSVNRNAQWMAQNFGMKELDKIT